jgi:hypothetical protein
MQPRFQRVIFLILLLGLIGRKELFAFDQTITIPAEKSEGVVLTLPAGTYKVEIAGGAVALFYPIHPAYNWLYSLCIGTDSIGGQDEPTIGALYFEPQPKVTTQAAAEASALEALKIGREGTSLVFVLDQEKPLRFWVSDFDYSDNSGSVRVRIYSLLYYSVNRGWSRVTFYMA